MAIAMRAVVPVGYMVAPKATAGAVTIVLCEPQAVRPADAGAQLHDGGHTGDKPAHAGDQKTDHPCVFSGFNAAAGPDASTLVSAAEWREVALAVGFGPPVAPGRGIAAPPPPSTGPPLLI